MSVLSSLFVESLDLLVFASEENNICKCSFLMEQFLSFEYWFLMHACEFIHLAYN